MSLRCKFYDKGLCKAGDSCSYLHKNNEDSSSKAVCQFFLKGSCRYGKNCRNLHIAPPAADSVEKSGELCVFHMVNKCRYSNGQCKNIHGMQCPRCLLHVLHPMNLDVNEAHFEECLARNPSSAVDARSIECGICRQKIMSNHDPRFGLLICQHAFCLACIRRWRSDQEVQVFEQMNLLSNDSSNCSVMTKQGNSELELEDALEHLNLNASDSSINKEVPIRDLVQRRSCPLCRVMTYFVTPSSLWIVDANAKQKVVEEYKKKMATIHCKYFDRGYGTCPFGSSCFYIHQEEDPGKPMRLVVRSFLDSNSKLRTLDSVRLCDTLTFRYSNSKR